MFGYCYKIFKAIYFNIFLISIFLILILVLILKNNYVSIYCLITFNTILVFLFLTYLLNNYCFIRNCLVTNYIEQALYTYFIMLTSIILELFKKSSRFNFSYLSNLQFIPILLLFSINFNLCEGDNLPNNHNNTVETVCLLIFFYLLGYSLGYIHSTFKKKSVHDFEYFHDNIMYGPEPKPMGLNSIQEVDLFHVLYNWEYILFIIILFVLFVSIGFIIRSYIVSKWSIQKTSLWSIKINYIFLNLIIFLFILYLNNSMIFCLNDSNLSLPNTNLPLPNANGDNNLIVLCILISILVAGCLFKSKNKSKSNTDLNIDLIEETKEENLPRLEIECEPSYLFINDKVDDSLTPILVTICVGIAIGLCIYYLYYFLNDHEIFYRHKRKKDD